MQWIFWKMTDLESSWLENLHWCSGFECGIALTMRVQECKCCCECKSLLGDKLKRCKVHRVRIKRIAIAKCDPFFNYRDANVANSTKFAIPNFGRNISFLLFFFRVVTFSVLSCHFLRITHSRNTIISYFQWLDSRNTQQRESRQTRASSLSNQF